MVPKRNNSKNLQSMKLSKRCKKQRKKGAQTKNHEIIKIAKNHFGAYLNKIQICIFQMILFILIH